MMATADQIPSDLTLEIGADVGPEQFLALTRAFFGYIAEIAQMVAPKGEEPSWTVEVRKGSALIGMLPTASVSPEIARLVYVKVCKGAESIAGGDIDGAGLSESAMKHLKTLSEGSEGGKGKAIPIKIWVEKKPIQVNAEIARVIREDWRAAYSDYGTIEGRLRTIQDAGTLQLLLKDELLSQTVKCFFPEAMLEEVFEKFRKRVEVSGMIHYRKNGTPISIEVARIDKLPNDEDLPSIGAVRGILRAAG